ncbi:hypothetical protein L209DRAFT_752203 [Thermothelomyces heterothallicus CBS 203.75]
MEYSVSSRLTIMVLGLAFCNGSEDLGIQCPEHRFHAGISPCSVLVLGRNHRYPTVSGMNGKTAELIYNGIVRGT